ncbi:phospholipase D-like domain-containing protein [Hahella ganghwensis]|uniref:phospholipase D-like domain-containing protein n=1 Tax=Hahella ganghwensis TaxID=286420 RepID=UPI00035E2C5A|nr:phospholipase D-like domain-containing protein [Hahella ganghwensis]
MLPTTRKLEKQLIGYVADDYLSKEESKTLRTALGNLPNEDISYLRNRLFDHARARLVEQPAGAMEHLRWLERCVKLFDATFKARQSTSSAWFSPGEDCRRQIISHLNGARRHINICVFTISDNDIAEAIQKAHDRGVTVRIISDNDKRDDTGSDITMLQRHGVAVRVDNTPDHMHHKFCVVDGAFLINGSFNWTRSATTRNQENIVVTDDLSLINDFMERFELLWKEFDRR